MNEPIMIQGPLSAAPLFSGNGRTTLTPDHEEIERGGRALTADIGQRRAAQPPPDDDCGDGGADALTLGVRQGRSQQQAHQRGPERA